MVVDIYKVQTRFSKANKIFEMANKKRVQRACELKSHELPLIRESRVSRFDKTKCTLKRLYPIPYLQVKFIIKVLD